VDDPALPVAVEAGQTGTLGLHRGNARDRDSGFRVVVEGLAEGDADGEDGRNEEGAERPAESAAAAPPTLLSLAGRPLDGHGV